MSPEAQRIAIAGACPGWKEPPQPSTLCEWTDSLTGTRMLSDPLEDLNAMREAEKVLTHSVTAWADQRTVYAKNLREILSEGHGRTIFDFDMIHATAAQRSEAFLKTLGLWSHGGRET